MPELKILQGNHINVYSFDEKISIGRLADNDIHIDEQDIAPRHCKIVREGNIYKTFDLSGDSGTFVNGTPIRECEMHHGDKIFLANIVIFFLEDREKLTKRRRSIVDDLEPQLLKTVFRLNEPIELGRCGFQKEPGIPLEKFCHWSGALAAALFLDEEGVDRLVDQYGLDDILGPTLLLLLNPLLHTVKKITDLHQIDDFSRYGISLAQTPCNHIEKAVATPLISLKNERVAHFTIEQHSHGVLFFFYGRKKKKFSKGELAFVEALGHQLASRFGDRQLFLQAAIDPLTRLYNRGFFEQHLRKEVALAKENDYILSLVLIDMDYFSHFNEQYGVEEGDQALAKIGRIIVEHLSANDLAARYGGKKMVALLPRQSSVRAFHWAETLCSVIKQRSFCGATLSASIGIATYPDNAITPEGLVKRADQALFRAKFEGRDKVVYYDENNATGDRADSLAGVISGDSGKDYNNIQRLMETLNVMTSFTDFERLVEELVDKVLAVTHAERAIIFLGDNPQNLKIHFGRNIFQQRLDNIEGYSSTIPQKVVELGEPLCLVDERQNVADTSLSMAQYELRTVMCAPLQEKDRKVFGVLYVDSRAQRKKYETADLIFFETIARQIALALERGRLHQMAAEKERLQHEVKLASKIQERVLPQKLPDIPRLEIYGQIWPAREVGGDYYDVIHTGNYLYLCIGDVSGKGVGSGLIMVMAHTALHTLVKQYDAFECSDLLYHLNNIIHENTKIELFMSMIMLRVDLKTYEITYSGAGHEHIIIYRGKQKKCETLATGGIVLGLRKNLQYPVEKLNLSPGDRMFLYTDGATEAPNSAKEQYGLEKLVKLAEKYNSQPCQTMCRKIFDKIQKFMGKAAQYDDITLLALHFLE